MRFAAGMSKAVLWLAATVALAVAIPAAWAQCNVIDGDGYAALAQKAAADPALQAAVASELTTRAMALIAERGRGRHLVDSSEVHDAATAFTSGPGFPPLFAQLNRAAHGWLFAGGGSGDPWVVDLAPMLRDASLQAILSGHNVKVPATLTVPLTVSGPLRQGQLSRLAAWGPRVSIGAAALSGLFALLTVAVARRRGRAVTSLGVSALLVGAAGWAVTEAGGRYVNQALNRTTGDIRRIAEVMVDHAEAGLRHWLNLTLVAGAALVVSGVVVAVLGAAVKKAPKTA